MSTASYLFTGQNNCGRRRSAWDRFRVGWGEESGNAATDLGADHRAEDKSITTAAALYHLDHIADGRGNSANQGGQGDKVATGFPGARNQNYVCVFHKDLLSNLFSWQFLPYFIASEMPRLWHFYIFDIRMLLQLMIYHSLIGRVFFFLMVHFISHIFASLNTPKNICMCLVGASRC